MPPNRNYCFGCQISCHHHIVGNATIQCDHAFAKSRPGDMEDVRRTGAGEWISCTWGRIVDNDEDGEVAFSYFGFGCIGGLVRGVPPGV
jgi:hypothetical protein